MEASVVKDYPGIGSTPFRIPLDFAGLRIWREVRREVRRLLNGEPAPVIVYQMGRVGSTALVAALEQSKINRPLLHAHFLSPNGVRFLYRLYVAMYGSWRSVPENHKRHVLRSHAIGKYLNRARQYQVITLVRDPVATNLSGFFHNWRLRSMDRTDESEETPSTIQRLQERFLSEYPHSVPLQWFDHELNGVFEIDLFASPFPREDGHQICHGRRATVLAFKSEQLSECVGDACSQFLDVPDVFVKNEDHPINAISTSLYKAFVRHAKMPASYLRQMYESKVARHFYSESERRAFCDRWRLPDEQPMASR